MQNFKQTQQKCCYECKGYDIERIINGDNSQRVISDIEKQSFLKEHDANKKNLDEADKIFEQVKTKYESEVIQ